MHLHHVRVEDELIVRALRSDLALLHNDNLVGEMDEVDRMSDKHTRAVLH